MYCFLYPKDIDSQALRDAWELHEYRRAAEIGTLLSAADFLRRFPDGRFRESVLEQLGGSGKAPRCESTPSYSEIVGRSPTLRRLATRLALVEQIAFPGIRSPREVEEDRQTLSKWMSGGAQTADHVTNFAAPAHLASGEFLSLLLEVLAWEARRAELSERRARIQELARGVAAGREDSEVFIAECRAAGKSVDVHEESLRKLKEHEARLAEKLLELAPMEDRMQSAIRERIRELEDILWVGIRNRSR